MIGLKIRTMTRGLTWDRFVFAALASSTSHGPKTARRRAKTVKPTQRPHRVCRGLRRWLTAKPVSSQGETHTNTLCNPRRRAMDRPLFTRRLEALLPNRTLMATRRPRPGGETSRGFDQSPGTD